MKKFIYIICITAIVAAAFSGCNTQPEAQSTPVVQQTAAIEAAATSSPAESSPITIIVPFLYSGSYDTTITDEYVIQLKETLSEKGFDAEFNMVYLNTDSPTCYDEYLSYLAQSLNGDNTIAFVPGYKSESLENYIELADLSKLAEESAPDYYQYALRNPLVSQSNDALIASSLSDFDNITAVFISNSILSKYGSSIQSSDDYLKFISWADTQYENSIPSVILTFHEDITARSNILYDIFLPSEGYIPLGNYLGKTYSLCVDAKKPEKIYDTTKLAFFDSMYESIEVNINYSKIVIKHENNAYKNFSQYSSVVMPLGDMYYYSNIPDYNFYPPNYSMVILNADMFLERQHENTYIAAAKNTDQSETMRFINAVYSDMDIYMLLKYGEFGVDYSFDTNEQIVLSDEGNIYQDYSPLSKLFSSLEFESNLRGVPYNYLDELNSIEYVKGDNFARQYENFRTLTTTNNYIFDASNRLIRRWEMSVRALELTTERKVDYVAGSFRFDNIEDLIVEIVK
ncbi:MAG: hypothetical protein JXN65_05195 [Clostridia bacterium]|nr:hypothetical protein [Clostridia bacterium]